MTLVQAVLRVLDPRLRGHFLSELREGGRAACFEGRLVLVGHRAAGKSALLPAFAAASSRLAVDLDDLLERTHGLPVRALYAQDPEGFRAAERLAYSLTPKGAAVAVGGGFLSLHADLLANDTAVLVPVSLATYCERLRADATRPRLAPHLSHTEELAHTWHTREAQHRRHHTVSLGAAVRALAPTEERAAWFAS